MTQDARNEWIVEDDLAGKSEEEIEQERRLMAERAERVRRWLNTNQTASFPIKPKGVAENAKEPDGS